jgi:heat-inducible transcriptional repressor
MELTERKKKILKAVVDSYIETAEPVGSKALAENAGLGVSPATIRNEMADLEALGYLEQPHTSAGRIPSAKGYRLYVNELMMQHKLTMEESQEINQQMSLKLRQMDKAVDQAGKLISDLTNYPTYALAAVSGPVTISRFDIIQVDNNSFIVVVMLSNKAVKNKLMRVTFPVEALTLQKLSTQFNGSFTDITEEEITPQLIASAERAVNDTMGLVSLIASFAISTLTEEKSQSAYLAGASHILEQPEYRDIDKAQKLITYLSDDRKLASLPMPDNGSDVKIMIGPENVAEELKDSSVIVASYDAGDNMKGLIGVVGPTRIDYATIAAKLSFIAQGLSELLAAGGSVTPQIQSDIIKALGKGDE